MLRCVAGEVCLEGGCGEFGRNEDGDEIIDAGFLIDGSSRRRVAIHVLSS